MTDLSTLPAGEFLSWLNNIISGEPADVPCGTCNACCRASYFIHVTAQDQDARRAIPQALLFQAPGMAKDTQIMGFSESGSCPMLADSHCTIYSSRPATCRDYDCRIFAATETPAGGAEKKDVNNQVNRWRFEYPNKTDELAHEAVRRAVSFLRDNKDLFVDPKLPDNPSKFALLALKIYSLFLADSEIMTHEMPGQSSPKINHEQISEHKLQLAQKITAMMQP